MKYPIEIELTDNCTLKCEWCVNSFLENKWFISRVDFDKILDYIQKNLQHISYVNLSWIWDVFIHPDFSYFVDQICSKFQWKNFSLLIPNKWQAFNKKILKDLQKLVYANISFNVSIWFFSLVQEKNERLLWSKQHPCTFSFLKSLRKNNIPCSIELASNNLAEFKYLKKIANTLGIGYSFQWMHNFWWHFIDNNSLKYYKPGTFSVSEEYVEDNFFCKFIPFISKDLKLFPCSISWKKDTFFVRDFREVLESGICFQDVVADIRSYLWKWEKCKKCTIYKISTLNQ